MLPSLDRLVHLLSGDIQSDDLPLWEIVWTLNARWRRRHRLRTRSVWHDARRLCWSISTTYGVVRPGGPVALLTRSETESLVSEDTPWYDPKRATLLVWIREERSGAPG